MHERYPDIYEILPSKPTPKKYRSFMVKRAAGNLLIPCFATSSTIEGHFDSIAARGGLSRQLLGDSHFKSAHCDAVAARFGAPLYCSEVEAPDVTRTVTQIATFPFTRHHLDATTEVIPTPGHRDGGVCYLITAQGVRYLFVGDFIWHDGTRWIPTATKAGHRTYAASLDLLNSIPFDVLLANSIVSNPVASVALDNSTARDAFFSDLRQQLILP